MNVFTVSVAVASKLPEHIFPLQKLSSLLAKPLFPPPNLPSLSSQLPLTSPKLSSCWGQYCNGFQECKYLSPHCWPVRSDLTAKHVLLCCRGSCSACPAVLEAGDALHHPCGTLPAYQLMLQKGSHMSWDTWVLQLPQGSGHPCVDN